ncbi:hypothetical protein EVAR_57178_1 [Eumeta japonica]|uniref:Uncharacterized protein n=1 Tax=Eumeta variegata TaxID=151549 RepID=A0A4C1Z305_EUMVA|nr:hypothetical protein EVAR_57178_1 [Eumeta japonica]
MSKELDVYRAGSLRRRCFRTHHLHSRATNAAPALFRVRADPFCNDGEHEWRRNKTMKPAAATNSNPCEGCSRRLGGGVRIVPMFHITLAV